MTRRGRKAVVLTLTAAMATAASAPLNAAEAKASKAPEHKVAAAASPAPAAGWRAFRDRRTGKLREPTPEEALELSRQAARKSAAPVTFEVVVHPDGTKSVDLQGAFDMSMVAHRNADGSLNYECVPAAGSVRKPASPPAAPALAEK
jgi:hypothetical protein